MLFTRKNIGVVVVLVAALVMMVAVVGPASAQTRLCSEVGARTNGAILVDVPATFFDAGLNNSLVPSQVGCRVLLSPEAGTPLRGNQAIPDYAAIVGVDVYTTRASSRFEIYNPPVRVCFQASSYGVSAEAAISPEDLAAGVNGPALMYSDARHVNTFKRASDPYVGGARNFVQLNVVPDGVPLGYICGDLSYPGSVNLVPLVPPYDDSDPAHANFADAADRCTVAGASDCRD